MSFIQELNNIQDFSDLCSLVAECKGIELISQDLFATVESLEPGFGSDIYDDFETIATIRAKELNIKPEFQKAYKRFKDTKKSLTSRKSNSLVAVEKFPIEYNLDGYIVDFTGIYNEKGDFISQTVALPIMSVEDIDTGISKVKMLMRIGIDDVKQFTIDREKLISASQVTKLSAWEFDVSSETAKEVVRYFRTILNSNRHIIPRKFSQSRLGWRDNEFIPYSANIEPDSTDDKLSALAGLIHTSGDRNAYIEFLSKIRQVLVVRLAVDACMASLLIDRIGCNSFVFEYYGKTGEGKTLLLKVLASLLGDPSTNGQYPLLSTFNTTIASACARMNRFHSLPCLFDDINSASANFDFGSFIYQVTAGSERERLDQHGNSLERKSWKNCLVCNGEYALSATLRNAGELNRVIEVNYGNKIFYMPTDDVSDMIEDNYGWVLQEFVPYVATLDRTELKSKYRTIRRQLDSESTNKQRDAMALILLADNLLNDCFKFDEPVLSVASVSSYMMTQQQVGNASRAYEEICAWIEKKYNSFTNPESYEINGMFGDDREVFINVNNLKKYLSSVGITYSKALLNELYDGGYVKYNNTIRKRIFGRIQTTCIVIKLQDTLENEIETEDVQGDY